MVTPTTEGKRVVSENSVLPSAPARRGFDFTISVTHIITFVVIFCGVVGFAYRGEQQLSALDQRTARIENKIDKFTDTIIDAAVLKERLKDLERRLDIAESRR